MMKAWFGARIFSADKLSLKSLTLLTSSSINTSFSTLGVKTPAYIQPNSRHSFQIKVKQYASIETTDEHS